MTRLERLQARLDELRRKQNVLLNRRDNIGAIRLNPVIADLQEQIEEARKYEPQRLAEAIPPETLKREGLSTMLVETHLAADYLADCAAALKSTLGKLGFVDCNIFPMLKEIGDRAQQFANIVCHPEFAGLSDFMCNNEGYIDALHGFSKQYIHNKLKIQDERN